MSKVEIDLHSHRASIVVDGHEMSRSVQGFSLKADVRSIPKLTLDLAVFDETKIESDHTAVHMHGATYDLLVAAGWTPPEQADPTRLELRPT